MCFYDSETLYKSSVLLYNQTINGLFVNSTVIIRQCEGEEMKSLAVFISIAVLFGIFAGTAPLFARAEGTLIGDVDKDGAVTVSDALRVLRVCAGIDVCSEKEIEIYDVWQDGEIGIDDALGVLRSSVGIIGTFGKTGVNLVFEPNAKASEAGVTQQMLDRAILSVEGTQRVAKVMDKAARGENISVVAIGGSITEGYGISVPEKRYANIVYSWWKESFPGANVSFRNSGIGGTGSMFGVHRLERDVFSYDPDLLIVEFAVNDDGDYQTGNPESYENLIRRVLVESPDTAVLILFVTGKTYVDKQYLQAPIGQAYGIPMISYRDAILPEIEAEALTWEEMAPDELHPSEKGHAVAGGLITSYLDGVKRVFKDSSRIIPAIPGGMIYTDRYMNAEMYWAGDGLDITSSGSWKVDGYTYHDYVGSLYSSSSKRPLEFEVECKNLMIFYERTANQSAAGTVKIQVSGGRIVYVRSYFENGWEYLTVEPVFGGETAEKRTVKITPTEGKFRIAAVLIA